MVKNLPAVQKTWVQSLGQKDPLEKGIRPILVFLPGEFHGQSSLADSVYGVAKSQTTEQLTLSLQLKSKRITKKYNTLRLIKKKKKQEWLCYCQALDLWSHYIYKKDWILVKILLLNVSHTGYDRIRYYWIRLPA